MNIIFYSDINYEYQAKSLIESILLNVVGDYNIIYYTVGFNSTITHPKLTTQPYGLNPNIGRFEFYKPAIMLDALKRFGGHFLFLDTDIIIGKRFNLNIFKHELNFPLLSMGNWDYPFCDLYENDVIIPNTRIDEQNLKNYFNVQARTMDYVYTCMVAFNENCEDILLEWKSVCENEFLISKNRYYLPFYDETALNVILWRRNVNINLGQVFLNTIEAIPLLYVEENENIVGDANNNHGLFGSSLMRCMNSSNIMLYHGIKDVNELDKVIKYIKNESK